MTAEQNLTAAIAGPAAYPVIGNEARALSAALVIVVAESEMADRLSAAGTQWARDWVSGDFGEHPFGLDSSAHWLG